MDGKGKIYVVDNKASAICVFLTNGRFIGRFVSRGVGEDHLAGPHFIGINSFGHSVVSDFHNHAVKVMIQLPFKFIDIKLKSNTFRCLIRPANFYIVLVAMVREMVSLTLQRELQ